MTDQQTTEEADPFYCFRLEFLEFLNRLDGVFAEADKRLPGRAVSFREDNEAEWLRDSLADAEGALIKLSTRYVDAQQDATLRTLGDRLDSPRR